MPSDNSAKKFTPGTAVVLESPNAEQVDAHAQEYKRLEKKLDEAKIAYAAVKKAEGAQLDKLHGALIDLVRTFGGKHAEKSKILHGIEWELMATFGSSYGIDAAATERLRIALKGARKTRLLKKLFIEEKSWRLAPDAAEIMKGEEKLPDDLAVLALACFTFTPNTSKLEVRPRKKAVAAAS